jgi:hypothetical protein
LTFDDLAFLDLLAGSRIMRPERDPGRGGALIPISAGVSVNIILLGVTAPFLTGLIEVTAGVVQPHSAASGGRSTG